MPREVLRSYNDVRGGASGSPQKSVLKIPLNDDREEKSVRFKSRQALHEMQINQIKAAASPMRKRKSLGLQSGSPRTPSGQEHGSNGSPGLSGIGGTAVTPMKRVPILANFEEWMKMATDNKINAANSWNFALIDYFHDMSLLKEGDGVNFQRASCTLDGCVKIYTSRVDSVATETGKLLSGLADGGSKKTKDSGEEGAHEGDEEEEGEEGEGTRKRQKKKVQRSSEATLASSFAQLQLKKMELEFAVDPLFKKASADFDEGGAKGLLLNHLTIDTQGRIVFDSSDDAQQKDPEERQQGGVDTSILDKEDGQNVETGEQENQVNIDLEALARKFFPDLAILVEQDICPSLKTFELGGADTTLDIPFLKPPEEQKDQQSTSETLTSGDVDGLELVVEGGFDDDDDGMVGGFDVAADVGFGEGGEAWAKEAAVKVQNRPYDAELYANQGEEYQREPEEVDLHKPQDTSNSNILSREQGTDQDNILNYFDQALQTNWAGPEHWRIRKIKGLTKPPAPTAKRKEKEPFEIDFMAPLTKAMADMLYTQASSNSVICLPKSQWKSRTRNLLPDDKHFNSRQLLRLFLKPKVRIGGPRMAKMSKLGSKQDDIKDGDMDKEFWARQRAAAPASTADDEGRKGDYDANFFQDDGHGVPSLPNDDDDDFADAREAFSPELDQAELHPTLVDIPFAAAGTQEDGFGTQLVTQSRRLRPEYVQYARVAKKVDVRRLKEEMWRAIGFDELQTVPPSSSRPPAAPLLKEPDGSLQFTAVINNLQSVYPKQVMADISTSYCFICLLHLANEKGLTLANEDNFEDIRIRKDFTAGNTEDG